MVRYAVLLLCLAACAPARKGNGATLQDGQSAPAGASAVPDAYGVYSVGGAVSRPKILNWVEPQFTEEARKKKVTGTCVLSLVVGADGMPRDVRVLQSISTGLAPKLQSVGLGLDEKARQAVQQYSFQPSLYQGQPVAVKIHIDVTFRLR